MADDGQPKKEGASIEDQMKRYASMDEARLTAELLAEFNAVCAQTPGFDNFRMHPNKNRYNGNIYLYDHTRVVLQGYSGGDYIHASYIATSQQQKRFILTQAPLPETINDFWHMVAQEQVQVIAAMCQFDDPGASSADDPFPVYWPQTKGQTQTYGKVQVVCGEIKKLPGIAITQLKWNRVNQQPPRSLTHLHLQAAGWEAGGFPTTFLMQLIDLVAEKEAAMMKANGHAGLPPPIIVHCGSGTARSGQFTALAIATEAVRRGWSFSLKDIIIAMQSQRYGVLREQTQVMAMCYGIVDYSKRHNHIDKGKAPANLDNVMEQMKRELGGGSG